MAKRLIPNTLLSACYIAKNYHSKPLEMTLTTLCLARKLRNTCGLKHGEPAQRGMFKAAFDRSSWVLGVPLVLMMQHHQHKWDPISGRSQSK